MGEFQGCVPGTTTGKLNMKTKYKAAFLFTLMVLGWVIFVLFQEVNGPKKLGRIDTKQAAIMVNKIVDAVKDYKRANAGRLPTTPLETASYLEPVDSFIPLSARVRLRITDVEFWKTPELMNVFGLWTVIGTRSPNDFLVILNPSFFGPGNVVVANVGETTTIETVQVNRLNEWISQFEGTL